MKIKELEHSICQLGECPVWDEQNNCFYWSDIILGKIYKYYPDNKKVELIYETECQIGGMLLDEDNTLILFTDKDVRRLTLKTQKVEIMYDMNFETGERFNDAIMDSAGRLWAGTLDATCSRGKLYRFETGKEPMVILRNLRITNGMGFSGDNRIFYHTDSIPGIITKYEYNMKTGEIQNGRLFFKMEENDGCPDGLEVDTNDNIWIACWGGSQIMKLSSSGEILERIAIPAKQPSSLAFGANKLLITTAAKSADNLTTGYNNDGVFIGGKSYIIEFEQKGKLKANNRK